MMVVVGCSSNETEEKSNNEDTKTEDTAEGYPITIKHVFGETVIEEKPERVASIAWSNQDVALALGVIPVGFSAANYGVQDDSGMLPWTAEKLKELGEEKPNIFQDTDGLDFEAIADAQPDVILAAYSGVTQEEYDTLSEIAPVVAYQETPWVSSWKDTVLYDAMAMGMEQEGKKLIADTEQLITDKAATVPEMAGKKAAFVAFSSADLSKFYIYTPGDPRGEFLEELGMQYPENITSQITDENSFYLELSSENADILNDLDIFVTYGDEKTLAALQADPLFGKVPAVQRGSVVVIEDNTPLAAAGTPSPLSIEYTIDHYLKLISEAISKVN
ncbi:iron-siderophore ABC transporter substrate-binding protein [Bacillus sp. Hm123]|uniref:iron-siderophore ABC transporter substrate-binding protein n=1 Tax=Bacillus sp. Hm123 TaxID=3450745 RepID=UPI003F4283C0